MLSNQKPQFEVEAIDHHRSFVVNTINVVFRKFKAMDLEEAHTLVSQTSTLLNLILA